MQRAALLSLFAGLAACSAAADPMIVDAGTHDATAADAAAPGADAATTDADGEPAACAESPTGNAYAAWPMPDPTMMGTPGSQSYDTSSPDVVVDKVTHLVWQRNIDATTRAFAEAKAYCA